MGELVLGLSGRSEPRACLGWRVCAEAAAWCLVCLERKPFGLVQRQTRLPGGRQARGGGAARVPGCDYAALSSSAVSGPNRESRHV